MSEEAKDLYQEFAEVITLTLQHCRDEYPSDHYLLVNSECYHYFREYARKRVTTTPKTPSLSSQEPFNTPLNYSTLKLPAEKSSSPRSVEAAVVFKIPESTIASKKIDEKKQRTNESPLTTASEPSLSPISAAPIRLEPLNAAAEDNFDDLRQLMASLFPSLVIKNVPPDS
jgi:hypothetical protein